MLTVFKKSGMKPSEFCKTNLKLRNVKAYDFVAEYFKDVDVLLTAVKNMWKYQRYLRESIQ